MTRSKEERKMASGHRSVSSSQRGSHYLNPNSLNVQGRRLSPNHSIHGSDMDLSIRSSVTGSESEDEVERINSAESYSVLDGVRDMNHMLVKQIETLRIKIQIDERNHQASKDRLLEETDKKVEMKETEIDDLQESITNRDEKIGVLEKVNREKEKNLQNKCQEIDSMKQLLKKTEEHARKLQREMGKLKKQNLSLAETDTLYKDQNEEINKLTNELELMRSRLATMEQELHRAMGVIEKQTEQMEFLKEDRNVMQAKFKEDLENATKMMRREVERTREVMVKQYEEMQIIREQSKQMSSDVQIIKKLLLDKSRNSDVSEEDNTNNTKRQTRSNYPPKHNIEADVKNNVKSYNPPHHQQYGSNVAAQPQGPSGMTGRNIRQSREQDTSRQIKRQPTIQRENTQSGKQSSRSESTRLVLPKETQNQSSSSKGFGQSPPETTRGSYNNLSPDRSARPYTGRREQTAGRYSRQTSVSHPNAPSYGGGNSSSNSAREDRSFPPICGLKDNTGEGRQASGRGSRQGLRRGGILKR